MLELTERQRALQVPRLLDELALQAGGETILLDNLEILFEVALKQDPLRLLQGLSRNRTVVAGWNGSIETVSPGVKWDLLNTPQGRQPGMATIKGYLTYAVPGHPEYRKYPVRDFLVVASPGLLGEKDHAVR
jgi:hypothetical protein